MMPRAIAAADEVEAAWQLEPIARMRAFPCGARTVETSAEEQALKRECREAVEAAVQQYLATPKQSTDAMFDYLYARAAG